MDLAVVIPVYREQTSPEEQLGIIHLNYFLNNYPLIFIAPKHYSGIHSDHKIILFPSPFFSNVQSYSKLLLSRAFYKKFLEFDYILIYQLDCLVFSDQLDAWCATGYDYIGAPWFVDPDDPARGFSRVGNGGLSLRNVRSHLQVLESRRIPPWKEALYTRLPDLGGLNLLQRINKQFKVIRAARRGVDWYTSHYSLNEDHFWSDRARLFWLDYKIAPVNAGLKFSFERFPRYCFERNDHQLPFGCHAWAKWDREFWEPLLIN